MIDAALSRQASRLHFHDPALEARFRADHDERSLRQWRIVTALGALAVLAIGLLLTRATPAADPVEVFGRYTLVLPWFLLMFAFTFWRNQRHRLQLIGAICCAAAVTLHFQTECFTVSASRMKLTLPLVVSLFSMHSQFMVAVAVAVPLHTRAAATMLLATVGCGYFSINAAYPVVSRDLVVAHTAIEQVFTEALIAGVLIAVIWARERLQRISFAQQEQLTAINAELARLNAEKNEFMAIAAHDLRAPLATVGAAAAQVAAAPANEKQQQAAALIAAQTGRMLALVDDYLGAHAAESGTLPLRLTRLNLGDIARSATQRHTASAAAKQQRLELAGEGATVFAAADPALLAQIVDNFVTNALKFSPAGATVRLEVQTAADHPRARLAVIDEGPGIAADEQANLFRKFGRASTRPTGGESSHGLGLAVAKRLAEAMGGTVGCDSEVGRGATFWVELPRVG